MGGPCFLTMKDDEQKNTDGETKKPVVVAPDCTDNFQIRAFVFEGQTWYSCEYAFQGQKVLPGPSRNLMCEIVPEAGETNKAHGMRAWRAGRKLEMRVDWDAVKVEKMLAVNRAKYAQNPDLAADLLATGTDTITGEPSTDWEYQHVSHNWSFWNGRIQMLIREELRDNPDMTASNSINSALIPVDRPLLEILRAEFLAYAAPVTAQPQ